MKKYLSILFLTMAFFLTTYEIIQSFQTKSPVGEVTNNTMTKSRPKPNPPHVAFDKRMNSIDDPASLWVVINKARGLSPLSYSPSDLVVPNIALRSNIAGDEKYVRSDMATALETMVTAAASDGVVLNLQSGYRSYNLQVSLYNSYVARDGQAAADTYSARPGHSEHQTGLAADLGGVSKPSCNVAACFATTAEGQWLANHAYLYGFIVRYTADKQTVTGYNPEPWHIRYVGPALSKEMHNDGIQTLEEFFGLPAAPDYQ